MISIPLWDGEDERSVLIKAETVILEPDACRFSEADAEEPDDWNDEIDSTEEELPPACLSDWNLIAFLARRGLSALIAGAKTREGIVQAVALRESLENALKRMAP